jgi:hypothetical protein
VADLLQTWQEVAYRLGAELDYADHRGEAGRLEELCMRVQHRAWLLEFAGRTQADEKGVQQAYTRIQCWVHNPGDFRFNVYEERIKDRLFKIIGLQDISISDRSLDKRFIVQANDEARIRALLELHVVRAALASPWIQHCRLDGSGESGAHLPQPEGKTHRLYGRTERSMHEREEILAHFQLFAALLDGMAGLGVIEAG